MLSICKDILVYNGYKVTYLYKGSYDIKNTDGLIELFYTLRDYYNNTTINLYRGDKSLDRKFVSTFIEKRMFDNSISRKEAIRECALIIETYFKYIEEFGIENTSLFIFYSDKFSWLVNRIIDRLNTEEEWYNKKQVEKMKHLV